MTVEGTDLYPGNCWEKRMKPTKPAVMKAEKEPIAVPKDETIGSFCCIRKTRKPFLLLGLRAVEFGAGGPSPQ